MVYVDNLFFSALLFCTDMNENNLDMKITFAFHSLQYMDYAKD